MAGEAVLVALEAASRTLGATGIRHALIGGAALPAWGRVRATADADFLILLKLAAARPVDLADAAELVAINKESLDLSYLEGRAARKNLTAPLREILHKVK